MSIGIIIGRFQTTSLTDVHKALIRSVGEKHDRIAIVLGVTPVRGSRINPLDFSLREKIIRKAYPEMPVFRMDDHPLDTVWSQKLDDLLKQTFGNSALVIYGTRQGFMDHYTGEFTVAELTASKQDVPEMPDAPPDYSRMDADEAFRAGIMFAYANTYPKVHPTVDVAIFRNNKAQILLGQKEIDKKWRLIGGFSDPGDQGYESAAMRELMEECGPIRISALKYEGSFNIADWRYRKEPDKIITTLFSADFISGEPRGSDDIAVVNWFDLQRIPDMISAGEIVEEHIEQLMVLVDRYRV